MSCGRGSAHNRGATPEYFRPAFGAEVSILLALPEHVVHVQFFSPLRDANTIVVVRRELRTWSTVAAPADGAVAHDLHSNRHTEANARKVG